MLEFLDKIYGAVSYNSRFLARIKYYGFIRFLIRIVANIYCNILFNSPFYDLKKNSISKNRTETPEYIISITSFPKRIGRLWIVIETIFRQSHKPDKIILWLSKEQFASLNVLPKKLLKLRNRGLEIFICENDLRSHKKYYYAFEKYPESCIITMDDDVLYTKHILKTLIEEHHIHPNCVIANHAAEISCKDGEIIPYMQWRRLKGSHGPSLKIMPVGMGGVLYPPKSYSNHVFEKDIFTNFCLYADDIWLSAMTHLNLTKVVKTNYDSMYLGVIYKSNSTLHIRNNLQGMNDKQLNSIRKYFIENRNTDPFLICTKDNVL